ncbi:hypothetical protein N7540_003306 [Penicillium herquei]|nr:hypothetical protein N7540_003306 [Penicillium herquei]
MRFSALIWAVLFLLTGHATAQTGTCSDTEDCVSGCCSTSGFCGFGPTFCGQGNCTSTCDAVAECGPYAPSDSYDCPLDVCCSQYGFCGTTSEFCGTGCVTGYISLNFRDLIIVNRSCSESDSSSDQRVIGYYESWSYDRKCNSWAPEDITVGVWTHLNYGFALIGSDYRISQMNSFDEELYPRFTNLKSSSAGLKVFISVGGWDAGGSIWSDMVSSEESRSAFIDSAIAFMKTYGFDGIDLDWEYPAASDRGGVSADTDNFVTFLKELKAACGSKYGISATLPSSYWYMQGFDVVGMEPYVDWFNFMSYDIHGTWDGNNPYTSAVVQPHTNLSEITEGLDLLWRNNISPSKVVLGEAFYGRSFTLSDSSCTKPGCSFSGGGTEGKCTATSGILSNAEIQQIISDNDLTPILEKEAAVKYVTWDKNQWVSYDDEETLEMKRKYANGKCLGGRMVWALDLDDVNSKESVSDLTLSGLSSLGDDVTINRAYGLSKLASTNTQNSVNLLAYWSDCEAEPQCEAGYTSYAWGHGRVYDADKGVYTGMGCHGGGTGYNRAFCVESDVQLYNCGWFGIPKACTQGCPAGMTLLTQNTHLGGFKTGCKNGHFSSFCCESIKANILLKCAQSNVDNLLTGGLGIQRKSKGYTLSDSIEETGDQCFDDLTPGSLNLVPARDYIMNNVPGYWTGDGKFSAIHNKVYSTATPSSCTTTITIETTVTSTTSKPKTVTCDANTADQACRHYWSVNSRVGGAYDTLVCPISKMKNRRIPRQWDNQHAKAWRSWISSFPVSLGINSCQRDEWPPFHFMAQSGSNYIQWLRFLPASQNGKAGQLWSGICGKEQKRTEWQGGPISGNICTTIKSVIYTMNAMSMAFKNVNSDPGLATNPCLPIITDDPGYALMTQDAWYGDNVLMGYDSAAYKNAPVSALTAGQNMPRKGGFFGVPIAKRSEFESEIKWRELEDDIFGNLEEIADDTYIPVNKVYFDPEKVVVDEGNSTRYATPQELWEELGLLKCRSHNCEKERAAVGHYDVEEIQSQMAIPTGQDLPIQTPQASTSRQTPASGPIIPSGPRETGRAQVSSEEE